jgi:hypothetical protein
MTSQTASHTMTDDERFEYEVLSLANEGGKFAIQIGMIMGPDLQNALQRLQERRWVMLIDISPVAIEPGALFRIFLASDDALSWWRKQR